MTDAEIINLVDTKTREVNNRLSSYMNITDLAIDSINSNLNTLITTDTFNALKSIVDRLQEIITGLSQSVSDLNTNKVTKFSDLKDIQLTGLTNNDLLRWNGTKWVNIKQSSIVVGTTWDSLQGKPSTFPSDWNTMINKPDISGGGGDTPTPTSISWNDITDKPSVFPPTTHNHDSLYVKRTGDSVSGTFQFTGPFTVKNGDNTVQVLTDQLKSIKAVTTENDVVAYQVNGSTGGGGTGGGVTSLAQLSDVNILAPSDGQGLVYEASARKWVNKAVQTGSTPSGNISWNDIVGKPLYLTDGSLEELMGTDFEATYLKKTGDTATGLITFNAGIIARNGTTVFKVAADSLVEVTGNVKASGDLIAYSVA